MGEISTSIHRNAKQKSDLVSIENDGKGILFKANKKNKIQPAIDYEPIECFRLLL